MVAPNIEQMEATNGLLTDIKDKCEEQGVPLIFALSRKRLGQVYGSRKKVSAVALLDVSGVEDMHNVVVSLMMQGRAEWEGLVKAGLPLPVMVLDEEEREEEEEE